MKLLARSTFLCMLAVLPDLCIGSTVQVSSPTDLQAAIDACDSGCRIELAASTFTLRRPIRIVGKKDLQVVGLGSGGSVLRWNDSLLAKTNNPLTGQSAQVPRLFTQSWQELTGVSDSLRPSGWLMWPYKGAASCSAPAQGPAGVCNDTLSPYSAGGFQRNAMVFVQGSSDIRLENLEFDGVQAAYFINRGIWDGKYDLMFGNVGLNLFQTLRTQVVNCELHHFWSAIYVNNQNLGCHSSNASSGFYGRKLAPRTACGAMGAHVVEGNRIHSNWWAVFSQQEWDMGSLFRENLSWNNRQDTSLAYGGKGTLVAANMTGGFLYTENANVASHVVSGNTMIGTPFPIGWAQGFGSTNTVFADNLVGPISLQDGSNSLQALTKATSSRTLRNAFFVDSASQTFAYAKIGKVATTGDSLVLSPVVNVLRSAKLPFQWKPVTGDSIQAQGHTWYDSLALDGAARLILPRAASGSVFDTTENRYCVECRFKSSDSTASSFWVPQWGVRNVDSAVTGKGYLGRSIGAAQPSGDVGVDGYLWAWNAPKMDANQTLHLPLRVVTKTAIGSLDIRNVVVTSRSCSQGGFDCRDVQIAVPVANVGYSAAENMALLKLSGKIRPSDTVLQIDLWAAAVTNGIATVLTPATWSWAKGMVASLDPFGPRAGSGSTHPLSALRQGGIWRMAIPRVGMGTNAVLTDLSGKAASLKVVRSNESCHLEISQAHPGTWILRQDGHPARKIFLSP